MELISNDPTAFTIASYLPAEISGVLSPEETKVCILETSAISGKYDAIVNAVGSFDINSIFLFLGSGFSVDSGELGTPHNQYIEWFLRGGAPFLLFNLVFLIYPTVSLLLSRRPEFVTLGCILAAAILISNNINTPFRAPYTSIFFWIVIGLFFKLKYLMWDQSITNNEIGNNIRTA